MKIPPILIFDGPDGAGKTTQSLLLGDFLSEECKVPVACVSFPVYEFPIGKAIGHCLGRWGPEKQISLPSPEDMATLYTLNRLETLPYLVRLVEKGHLLVSNRGPYSNLFSVARRALADGVRWDTLSSSEKATRINAILSLDNEFFSTLEEKRELVNIFLLLNPEESMELAKQKALSTLGAEPDRYEGDRALQFLVAEIYRDIAEGKVPGHEARLVEATRGRLSRFGGEESLKEFTGNLQTAERVSQLCGPIIKWPEGKHRIYLLEMSERTTSVLGAAAWEGGVNFEFRRILGNVRPNLGETRPELMAEIQRSKPNVWRVIDESRRLDQELARSRGIIGGKERMF